MNIVNEINTNYGNNYDTAPCTSHALTPSQVESLMKHTVSNHGSIDFLVNNGGGQFMSPLADVRKKGWNAVMDTNLNGTYYCLKHGKMPSVCAYTVSDSTMPRL